MKIRYWKELILFSGRNKHPRGQVAPEDGQHCLHPGDARHQQHHVGPQFARNHDVD